MPGHRPPNQAHKSQNKSAHKQFLDNPAIIIPAFRLGGGAPDDDQKCLEIELLVDTQEDKHSSRRAPNDGFADASAFANQCGPDAKQCSQDVTNRGGPARQRGTVDSFYPDGQYPVQKTFFQVAAGVSQLDFLAECRMAKVQSRFTSAATSLMASLSISPATSAARFSRLLLLSDGTFGLLPAKVTGRFSIKESTSSR